MGDDLIPSRQQRRRAARDAEKGRTPILGPDGQPRSSKSEVAQVMEAIGNMAPASSCPLMTTWNSVVVPSKSGVVEKSGPAIVPCFLRACCWWDQGIDPEAELEAGTPPEHLPSIGCRPLSLLDDLVSAARGEEEDDEPPAPPDPAA